MLDWSSVQSFQWFLSNSILSQNPSIFMAILTEFSRQLKTSCINELYKRNPRSDFSGKKRKMKETESSLTKRRSKTSKRNLLTYPISYLSSNSKFTATESIINNKNDKNKDRGKSQRNKRQTLAPRRLHR